MKHIIQKFIAIALVALLAACGTKIVKVEGDQIVNSRMSVRLSEAWNKVTIPSSLQPYDTWTQEGLSLDNLRLWAGLRSGQPLMTLPPNATDEQKKRRLPTFVASMQPDQLVNLLETLYANDGSVVNVTKVEPAVFAGEKGIRFEFGVTRKSDGVQLNGVGWVAVRKDEMFAASFVAPRLSFFPRLIPKAESVVKTAAVHS